MGPRPGLPWEPSEKLFSNVIMISICATRWESQKSSSSPRAGDLPLLNFWQLFSNYYGKGLDPLDLFCFEGEKISASY